MEERHEEAKQAWKSFADHLGKEEVRKFLSIRQVVFLSYNNVYVPLRYEIFSSDKIFSLYEDLRSSAAPSYLLNQYEEVITALISDVKKMEIETKKMEEKIAK